MTQQELFETITKIIKSPYTITSQHDKLRAIQVFLAVDEFLIDNLSGYHKNNYYGFDFGKYASKQIDTMEEKK